MKDLKISIILIIIGNLLYITNHFLTENINISQQQKQLLYISYTKYLAKEVL